jgi:Replication-relaxation
VTDLTVRQAVQADRDPEVLVWLARLQLATSGQISALGWPGHGGEGRKRRLRGVREAGLLEFVRTRRRTGRRLVLYRLTPTGAMAVAKLLDDEHVARGVRLAATEGVHLEHRLQVNETVLRLVDRLGQDAVEVLLPHERRLRWLASGGAWHEVTPDVVLVWGKAEAALVIEYDRGLRSVENVSLQLRRYREAAEQPDLPIWAGRSSIAYALHPPSPARAKEILQAAAAAGLESRVIVVAAQDLAVVVADAIGQTHTASR